MNRDEWRRGWLRVAGPTLIAGVLLSGGVAAQSNQPPSAQALQDGVEVRIRSGADRGDGPAVDESALRYYAGRGDRANVDAEIARLQKHHPGWEPPADLFGPSAAVDEQPLWDLYQQGNYDAVRGLIAELAATHPDWQPPTKLVELIEENEIRAELVKLEQEGAWRLMVELAAAHPRQITCARIDNLWRLAHALDALGETDELFATYQGIVETCPDLDQRFATLQKASGQLSEAQIEQLFALERKRKKPAAAAKRFATLEASLKQPADQPAISPTIARLYQRDLSLDEAEEAHVEVIGQRQADAARKLGWIYFETGRWQDAAKWFKRALRWQASSEAAEGLARAYAELGAYGEIEALAAAWPEEIGPIFESLRDSWISEAFENEDARTLLEQTESFDQPWAQLLRAWTFLRLDRPTEAVITFTRVADDDEAPPSRRKEAAYGLAQAQLALGALDEAEAVTRFYRIAPEDRHRLRGEILARRANAAFENQDYHLAVALLEERRSYAEPTRAQRLQEAWGRYHLGQRNVAKRMFEELHRVYATKDTTEALAVVTRAIDRIGL